ACSTLPQSAATCTRRACTLSMTSFGGVPSAFTSSLIGCERATSTCERAPPCVQARSVSCRGSPSGSGGTRCRPSTSSTNSLWRSGIIASNAVLSSAAISPAASEFGMTTSTPYGFPPTCSSIQSSSTSSWSFENASAPITPSPPARLTAATTSRQWLNAKIGNSMPKRSQMRVFTSAPCRLEPHRHALDAVDEVRAQALDPAVELHVGEAPEELLEHDLDLEPREGRAEAEVVPERE